MVSHLHGDHIFGLPGLITSYNLYRRQDTLTIYGPVGLQKFLFDMLESVHCRLGFELSVHEHGDSRPIQLVNNKWITIESIPLNHRIPTTGYLVKEKVAPRKIDVAAIEKYQIPYSDITGIQQGQDWIDPDGHLISNELLTTQGRKSRSYAYVSDTAYMPKIVPQIWEADLLYHEATFLTEHEHQAKRRFHSTTMQAARIAKAANVGKLVVGHFSSRYNDEKVFEMEAAEIFQPSIAATEGMMIEF